MPVSDQQIEGGLQHAERKGLLPIFRREAASAGVPIAALLAVASQESRLGRNMGPGGYGDGGRSWGIMQIHEAFHPIEQEASGPQDHEAIIRYGAELLATEYANGGGGTWWDAFRRYNSGDACEAWEAGDTSRQSACETGKRYADEVSDRMAVIERKGFTGDTGALPTPKQPSGGWLDDLGLSDLEIPLFEEENTGLPPSELDLDQPLPNDPSPSPVSPSVDPPPSVGTQPKPFDPWALAFLGVAGVGTYLYFSQDDDGASNRRR